MGHHEELTKEEHFLLEIVKDYVHECPTSMREGIDWNQMDKLAKKHQLSAIVYYQCKQLSGSDILKNAYYGTVSISAKRNKLYNSVIGELEKKGLDYVPYKGIVISQYYPQPTYRAMGDVDILTPDLDKAAEVMMSLGFIGQRNSEEWDGTKNSILFEMQSKFFSNSISLTDKQKAFFENYENYVSNHHIDVSYHFLLVVCHMMKHIKNGQGIGLRQFLDVALFMQNAEWLNWEWIFNTAEEIELLRFLSVTLNFVNQLFVIPIPSQTMPVSESILQNLLEKVLMDGSFQSNSHDRILAKKVNGTTTRKKTLMVLFPSINHMQEKYNYLVRTPILLPFAWMERILKYFFSTKKTTNRTIVITSDEIDNRKSFLSALGIQ